MDDYTQPQRKYAGTGENCNIVIIVLLNKVKNVYEIFGEYFFYQYLMVLLFQDIWNLFDFFVCAKSKNLNA